MVDLFSVLVSVSDISMPFYSTHSLVGPYAMTATFFFRFYFLCSVPVRSKLLAFSLVKNPRT